jgi:hypothetical protein
MFARQALYCLSHSIKLFFVLGIFEIGSPKLFTQIDLKQQSSLSLPPEWLGLQVSQWYLVQIFAYYNKFLEVKLLVQKVCIFKI